MKLMASNSHHYNHWLTNIMISSNVVQQQLSNSMPNFQTNESSSNTIYCCFKDLATLFSQHSNKVHIKCFTNCSDYRHSPIIFMRKK